MSDDAAIRAFPALAALIAIRDAGWTFVHRCDRGCADTGSTAIESGQADGSTLSAFAMEDDAMALRTDEDEPSAV
jgi:hypothetical protein